MVVTLSYEINAYLVQYVSSTEDELLINFSIENAAQALNKANAIITLYFLPSSFSDWSITNKLHY